uniref:NADH-ubiquinone oxidoreductase chain 5 n=1 Tax=Trichonephila clavata TaxID=2740835 RepID=Q1JQR2_TRICU|nr:NADH dehydrogenase subunit 5 [Trichonephila clavata]AAS15713.1 NADH dehydrogenase subunit 5 [Trichonephila clavata]
MAIVIMILSLIPFFLSIFLLKNSMFISIEMVILSLKSFSIPINLILDWMSMSFLFTVMLISSMILIFSMDYIPRKEHNQFSLLLISFVLSMSLLILSDNIIFILLGWDGLGLTSYILVIYYQNFSSAASGSITVFSNRFGDIMILLSIGMLTKLCDWNFIMNNSFPLIILIFMMLAAFSKSAQFPFSAWLPAAMAAPTPISALVHSSTLVTAGVYLMMRIMNYPHPTSMFLILIISSMTTIYASMSANWEMDMKKIIALSTLSQIAMMMFAIAIGMISLAFFHLIIHALFKSMMFLCGGVLIHSSSYQDMRKMGTFMFNSPIISSSLGIASTALMGIPFMSGFFSKDPIIEMMILSNSFSILTFMMIMSIGMTTIYSIRMMLFSMKFYLKSKPDINFHPSSFMEIPILCMTPLSIISGTFMSWIINPEQMIMIPNFMKIFIIISIIFGMMISISMSFMSKKYFKLGQPAISLWFNHFITTMPSFPSSKFMIFFLKNDKNWQESYGPKFLFYYLTKISPIPDIATSQMMFIIMILTLSPMLIFMW